MGEEIDSRVAAHRAGQKAVWALVDAESSRAVGMTTYLNLDPANRRLEIV